MLAPPTYLERRAVSDLVAVHHPDHAGSGQVVSRKLFDVDLKHYGYVLTHDAPVGVTPNLHGPSAGAGAYEAPTLADVDAAELEALRRDLHLAFARLAAYEERETELVLREQAVEARETEISLGGTDPVESPTNETLADLTNTPPPVAPRTVTRKRLTPAAVAAGTTTPEDTDGDQP